MGNCLIWPDPTGEGMRRWTTDMITNVMESRGIPYSLSELREVAASHPMDIYHRALMQWAVREIEGLQQRIAVMKADRPADKR